MNTREQIKALERLRAAVPLMGGDDVVPAMVVMLGLPEDVIRRTSLPEPVTEKIDAEIAKLRPPSQVTTKFRRRWVVLIEHHETVVRTGIFKTSPAAYEWAAEYVLKLRGIESFEASALTAMEQAQTAEEIMAIWWHVQKHIGSDHKIEILKSKQYS